MLVPFLCVKLSFVDNKEISLKARKYDSLKLSTLTNQGFDCSANRAVCGISTVPEAS